MVASHHDADPPSTTTLRVSLDGAVGRLTLAQPDQLNPIGTTALREIIDAARWLDRAGPTVVIVTGEGRAFSSGFDLREFGGAAGDDDGTSVRDQRDLGRQMADAVAAIGAVTLAAVKGPCVGGGVVLASACDLRVAADDAVFSIPEVDLGIPLTWGAIPRLVRQIGPALTNELVLTCRAFDAHEAKAIGFVNRVVARDSLEAEVDALAASLASKARSVVATTKRQVAEAAEAMVSTAGAWAEADLLEVAMRDPEARAAARAYLDRRSRPVPPDGTRTS